MKMIAAFMIIIAVAAAIIGFKIAIGVAALVAKVCFVLALVIGVVMFITGIRAGESIASPK